MIHIAASIDFTKISAEYDAYLAVLCASILKNTTADVTIHVFFIGTRTDDYCVRLTAMVERYRAVLRWHEVHIDAAFMELSHIHTWTPVILNKFYFPQILSDVEKVIFFDLDVVVKRDVRELWDIPMEGYAIAGVQYANSFALNREFNSYEETHTIDMRVNGGMVIMNLAEIRRTCDLLAQAKAFVREYPDVKGVDEVLFHHLFYAKTKLLPAHCQHFLGMDGLLFDEESPAVQDAVIAMHYAYESKPFHYVSGTPDRYFWQYFKCTPFCEEHAVEEWYARVGLMRASLVNGRRHIRAFYERLRENPEIVVFGTGVFARKLVHYLGTRGIPVHAFSDNMEEHWGRQVDGLAVLSPVDGLQCGAKRIVLLGIINERNNRAVREQFRAAGLRDGIDFFDAKIIFEDIRRD